MNATVLGPRELIDAAPMGRLQFRVIGICLVLSVVDGFDILVMSFAATPVAGEWALNGSQVGLLLSAGLVGMALGSALLAPLADRIGRRPLTMVCLVLATIGMVAGALATGAVPLGLFRVLTGLGIGGLVASLPVLVAEFTPARRQGTAIAIYASGLPLGGVLGGLMATAAISGFGWRGTFLAGAVLTVTMLVVVALWLPESIDYLALRGTRSALDRANDVLHRMGLPSLAAFPPVVTPPGGRLASLLTRGTGLHTALLWLAFFCTMAGFYFAASWTPRLIGQSDPVAGANAGLLLNVGGVVACLVFAGVALRASSRWLTVATLVVTGLAFALMGLVAGHISAVLAVTLLLGMAMNASGAGLFAVASTLYLPRVRTTAVGWAAAAGRVGAIVAPILVGLLADGGWNATELFLLFAVPLVIAGLAVAVIIRSSRYDKPLATSLEP